MLSGRLMNRLSLLPSVAIRSFLIREAQPARGEANVRMLMSLSQPPPRSAAAGWRLAHSCPVTSGDVNLTD